MFYWSLGYFVKNEQMDGDGERKRKTNIALQIWREVEEDCWVFICFGGCSCGGV